MQGSLLSNLGDGTATRKGIPTIATYNAMGYNIATFGNHEFDWGQVNLMNRANEALLKRQSAAILMLLSSGSVITVFLIMNCRAISRVLPSATRLPKRRNFPPSYAPTTML